MHYVSTRGTAPTLGFADALLTGLARDGGLYVPVAWPTLDARTVAGFAGKPYAEVAVEVMRPFVGGSISDADLSRMAREAYGSFRHPATAPLVQLNDNLFVLELFHGPTLAFKDLAMQLVSRLMDHVLQKRGERTTIVVAHRLSTERDADLVVAMADGAAVEQGSHAELLARDGLYARLVSAQALAA